MFALVLNDKVVDVSDNTFDVADPLKWVPCDKNIVVGMIYSGTAFVANDILPNKGDIVNAIKSARNSAVDMITVTTANGNSFDGNELAQNRMARAILSMTDSDTTKWVLADSSVASVTKQELSEALKLAGQAMTEIWITPYTTV